MADSTLDLFESEVNASKQHEVDMALAERDQTISRQKRQNKELQQDLKELRESAALLKNLEGNFTELPPIKAKAGGSKNEATIIAPWTDWHLFETVTAADVSGMNEYTTDIAEERIERLTHGLISWTEVFRTKSDIRHAVVPILGDIITNRLHEDQAENNAGTPPEELLFATQKMVQAIQFLLDNGDFETIRFICKDGNHGRGTVKIRHSRRCRNSWEWLMYKWLEQHFRNEPSVYFDISDGIHSYLSVYDWNFRFQHGDQMRYGGGIGGLTIPVNKALAAWNRGRHADFDIFGHFHTTLRTKNFQSCGCLVGYSPFALSIKAEHERAQQPLLVVDSKRFINAEAAIIVD